MKNFLILLIFFLSMNGVSAEDKDPYVSTSIIELIILEKKSRKLENKNVETFGFLRAVPSPHIYLTDKHGMAYDFSNSVRISYNSEQLSRLLKQCDNQHVWVKGALERNIDGLYMALHGVEDRSKKSCSKNI